MGYFSLKSGCSVREVWESESGDGRSLCWFGLFLMDVFEVVGLLYSEFILGRDEFLVGGFGLIVIGDGWFFWWERVGLLNVFVFDVLKIAVLFGMEMLFFGLLFLLVWLLFFWRRFIAMRWFCVFFRIFWVNFCGLSFGLFFFWDFTVLFVFVLDWFDFFVFEFVSFLIFWKGEFGLGMRVILIGEFGVFMFFLELIEIFIFLVVLIRDCLWFGEKRVFLFFW